MNKIFQIFLVQIISIVKGYTDELMKLFEDNVLNLRIRMPIISKHEPRNFITKNWNYLNRK
jgi:hypothetical protein